MILVCLQVCPSHVWQQWSWQVLGSQTHQQVESLANKICCLFFLSAQRKEFEKKPKSKALMSTWTTRSELISCWPSAEAFKNYVSDYALMTLRQQQLHQRLQLQCVCSGGEHLTRLRLTHSLPGSQLQTKVGEEANQTGKKSHWAKYKKGILQG